MDPLDQLDDAHAAAAFRRLVRHLRHRTDVRNIELMGLAGFCRNCLSEWVEDAAGLDRGAARDAIYGMPYVEWKDRHGGPPATAEELARMEASLQRNPVEPGATTR